MSSGAAFGGVIIFGRVLSGDSSGLLVSSIPDALYGRFPVNPNSYFKISC
jgi:hypothetical protein